MRRAAPSLGSGEIRCFTGLRGAAAVLVMLYHFTLHMPPGSVPGGRLLANGYLWVDLFFLLSGFVLAYGQARHFTGRYAPRRHATFLVSRIARVYPLYAVVIVGSAALILARGHLSLLQLVLNLTMVQGWGLAPSLEGAAWSVSTEWAAYLLFPLLLGITVLSSRRDAWLVGLIAAVALAILARSAGPFGLPGQARSGPLDIYSAATPAPLLRCLAEFSLGLLTFRLAAWCAASRAAAWSGPASMTAAALLLAALCEAGLDLAVVGLFIVLLVTLAQQRGWLSRALSTAVPLRLGQWSYSIYLLHDKFSHPAEALHSLLARHALPSPIASLVAVVVTALAVIGCSGLCFALVEQPLRRLVLRYAEPARGARPASEPAAVASLDSGLGA